MYRIEAWLNDETQIPAMTRLKVQPAFWLHLVPATEYSATLALVRLDDDPRWFVVTPGRPIPLIDSNGKTVRRKLTVRVPYGPDVPATFMVQDESPIPARIWPNKYQQKYHINNLALVAGGAGAANDILRVPCRGFRSGIISGVETTAIAANKAAILSVSVGVEQFIGGQTDFTRRTHPLPIAIFPTMDSTYHRNKAFAFPIPPGADWLLVRGWRYSAAAEFQGDIVLSTDEYRPKNDSHDGTQWDIPANTTVYIVTSAQNPDSVSQNSLCRYRVTNDAVSTAQVQITHYAVSNTGMETNLDNSDIVLGGTFAVAIGATVIGATGAVPGQAWFTVVASSVVAAQCSGSIAMSIG